MAFRGGSMMEYTAPSGVPGFASQPAERSTRTPQLESIRQRYATDGGGGGSDGHPNPLLGSALDRPSHGVRVGGSDPTIHGVHGQSMADALFGGAGHHPVEGGASAEREKARAYVFAPVPPNGRGTGAASSPRKQVQHVQQHVRQQHVKQHVQQQQPTEPTQTGAAAAICISCADGIPDSGTAKDYITSVTQAVKRADAAAGIIDLEVLEASAPASLDAFQRRERGLQMMRERCWCLVCCIPPDAGIERWLRAAIEVREARAAGNMTVIVFIDRSYQSVPPLIEACATKVMRQTHEIEKFISSLARRRAINERRQARGGDSRR